MLSTAQRCAIARGASSIYERAALSRTPAAADAYTQLILSTWNQAFAPGDPVAFGRRLTWDGLDADMVAAAAGGQDAGQDAGKDEDDVAASWTEWLLRFADSAPTVVQDLATGELPELTRPDDGGGPERAALQAAEPPFVELWIALLRAGRSALAEPDGSSSLSPRARGSLDRQLVRELAVYGALAAYELFNAFRQRAEPLGPHHGSPALYRAFIDATLNERFATMWTSFPVLARQLATVVETWVVSTRELLERLDADRSALDAFFNTGNGLGMVEDATPGLSDPHAGRRRVAILCFASGTRVVYKPRDLTIDCAFAELAVWFTDRGLEEGVPAPRVLHRRGYGWTEYVEREDFPDRESVSRYYRQAGSLLFITHLLGARDLHMENLVARVTGPTLIDLELLMQPIAHAPDQSGVQGADAAGLESCLRSGLLSLVEIGPGDEPLDLGGLRGTGATSAGVPSRTWKHLRTDALGFVEAPAPPAPVNNAVLLDGRLQLPEEYPSDVVAGFERAYRLALSNRSDLLAAGGPLSPFAAAEVRVIVRPTNQYGLLSAIRNVPRYQRDGVVHSVVVDALHRPLKDSRARPREWAVVVEERRATRELDVPRFIVQGDGRSLYSDGQPILRDYYDRSPLEAVRDRVSRLSERDGHTQRRFVSRAVEQSTSSRFLVPYSGDRPDAAVVLGADADLVSHASWIADELLAQAAHHRGRLMWQPLDELDRVDAHYLYDGAIGPGVFLAALAAVTGEVRWHEAALAALAPSLEMIEAPDFTGRASDSPIGGCSGLGSIVHGLARAGGFLQEERLLDRARRVAVLIDGHRIESDRYFDVVDGAAGALQAALALHEVCANDALVDIAVACGDRLMTSHVESAEGWVWPSLSGQHLTGYAHGSAGIAAALLRLFAATGRTTYRDGAARALEFVRGLFGEVDGNWPVSKPDPDNVVTIVARMNAWCHGAPGIVMAAAAAVDGGVDSAIVAQARGALETVERWSMIQADHLCCGHLGRADALMTASTTLGVENGRARAVEIAARVLTRARARRHFRLSTPGVEYVVFSPSFFQGLSGIGYQLLRLAAPEKVKSMLFFGAKGRL